jgi:hypothetical protein
VAKKRRPFNLKTRITSALRRIWFYSPQRRLVSAKAKAGGNVCELCKKPAPKLDIDHVKEVVPVTGFDNWSDYITRLFDGELMAICPQCHNIKTQAARKLRKKNAAKIARKRKRK